MKEKIKELERYMIHKKANFESNQLRNTLTYIQENIWKSLDANERKNERAIDRKIYNLLARYLTR